MGRWQPYLHSAQRTSTYGVPEVFEPKAVTMASRQPPPPPRKKQDGPLLHINQHPDSYLVLPYGKSSAKPMNPKMKVWIKSARWVQFFFRMLTLVGAIGTILCAIFMRGMGDTEGYMIRIPPGVDIANSLYAAYHLLRAAKSRPAGSSASYHFFALITDVGFIPFYIYTAVLAKRNSNQAAGTKGRWRTIFPTDEDADKVLLTTWIAATTIAALHCASMVLDLYLVVVFRQISRLPPDMNPLEDNLTSRRNTKHKHKNSSISAMAPLTADERRDSAQSGSSTMDPLITAPDASTMAFLHTRTESGMTYSPHTENSARHSRAMYSQPASAHQSHRTSRRHSAVSSKQEFYTPPTTAKDPRALGDITGEGLQADNWFVHDESEQQATETTSQRQNEPVRYMFPSKAAQGYKALSPYEDDSDEELERPMIPQPLRMNPPTPTQTPPPSTCATIMTKPTTPQKNVVGTSRVRPTPPTLQGTHTRTNSSDATSSRSSSQAATPKSRYYGDLTAASNGIRNGGQSPAHSPVPSPTKTRNHLPSATKQYTTNSPIVPKSMTKTPFSLDKKSFASVRRTGETGQLPIQAQSPRVVSRSGVDYGFTFEDDSDLGTPGRRRDVSGKIAEEGRGGYVSPSKRGQRGNELTYRKVSGVA